jgi:anthranilate 1,2-dioxygenase small subunit
MSGMKSGEQDEQTIRLGVQELIGEYTECIDEDRLEEWPDLFADPCRYLIISRANHEAGMRQGVMYAATRGMLLDRVFTIRRANLFEPHRYRHVVGPIRLKSVEDTTAIVHSHFIVARIMHTGETTMFATGRYLDRIDIATDDYRFMERVVVLDSDRIDTLLAIPI